MEPSCFGDVRGGGCSSSSRILVHLCWVLTSLGCRSPRLPPGGWRSAARRAGGVRAGGKSRPRLFFGLPGAVMDPTVLDPNDTKGLAFPIRRRVPSSPPPSPPSPSPRPRRHRPRRRAPTRRSRRVVAPPLPHRERRVDLLGVPSPLALALAPSVAPQRAHHRPDGQLKATTATEPNATHSQPKRNTNSPSGAPPLHHARRAAPEQGARHTMARLVGRARAAPRPRRRRRRSARRPRPAASPRSTPTCRAPAARPSGACADRRVIEQREGYVPSVTRPPPRTPRCRPSRRRSPTRSTPERPPDAASPALAPEAARCGYFASHAARRRPAQGWRRW